MIIARKLTSKDYHKTKWKRKFCLIPRCTDNGNWVWLETVCIIYEVIRVPNSPYFGYHYKWNVKSIQRLKYEKTDTTSSISGEEKKSEAVRMVTVCAGKSKTSFPDIFHK